MSNDILALMIVAVLFGSIKAVNDAIVFFKGNSILPQWILRKAWKPVQKWWEIILPNDVWHRLDLLSRILVTGLVCRDYSVWVAVGFFLVWSVVFEIVFRVLKSNNN